MVWVEGEVVPSVLGWSPFLRTSKCYNVISRGEEILGIIGLKDERFIRSRSGPTHPPANPIYGAVTEAKVNPIILVKLTSVWTLYKSKVLSLPFFTQRERERGDCYLLVS